MRKAVLLLFLAAALAGCSAGEVAPPGQPPAKPPQASQPPATQPPAPQPPTQPSTDNPAQPPAGGATQPQPQPGQPAPSPAPPATGGGIKFNPYSYTQVPTQDLPEPARGWLEQHRDSPAFAIFRSGKDTYLLAAAGQRNTGGYSIHVASVGDSNGQIEVVVQEQTPRPGQMVTELITWPVTAVKVSNLPDQPVHFVLTGGRGSGTYQPTVLK